MKYLDIPHRFIYPILIFMKQFIRIENSIQLSIRGINLLFTVSASPKKSIFLNLCLVIARMFIHFIVSFSSKGIECSTHIVVIHDYSAALDAT